MKNKLLLSALLLLLSVSMLFCGCEKVDFGDPQDTAQSETNAQANPGTVFGMWYSTGNQTVLVVPEDLKEVTFYRLKTGYYEYTEVITGTAAYEDHILTLTDADGNTYSWVFDAKNGTLSASMDNDTAAYTRCNELPTQHAETPFPDYASLLQNEAVTLGKYKELVYSDDCVAEAAISIFQEYYQSVEKKPSTVTDRPSKQGDLVNVDYTGYLDGVAFSGGSAQSQDISLIKNSGYIPGFAEGIIGKTAGSTFDVEVTFPEDYGKEELNGKKVIFTMTLNKIYDLTISDADVATYTNDEHKTYQSLLDETAEGYIKQDLWNQVLDESKAESMTEAAYGYFFAYYRDMYHYYAAMYGMEYEQLMTYYGLTEDLFIDAAKTEALQFLVAFAIAKQESITFSEDDYQAKMDSYIDELVESGEYTKEEAESFISETETTLIKAELTVDTVIDWIYTQNTK